MSGTLYGVTAELGKTAGGGWASGEGYSLTGFPALITPRYFSPAREST